VIGKLIEHLIKPLAIKAFTAQSTCRP
jgi:hypothetical protein